MNEQCTTHHKACYCREIKLNKMLSQIQITLAYVKAQLVAINNYDENRYKSMTAWQEIDKKQKVLKDFRNEQY